LATPPELDSQRTTEPKILRRLERILLHGTPTSATFGQNINARLGQVISARDPRLMQLSLSLTFQGTQLRRIETEQPIRNQFSLL